MAIDANARGQRVLANCDLSDAVHNNALVLISAQASLYTLCIGRTDNIVKLQHEAYWAAPLKKRYYRHI